MVVVFGGGWSKYNFPRMLEEWEAQQAKGTPDSSFTRARNLFYVTISRARHRLALLFLETLPDAALATLRNMVGVERVCELPHLK
ncbi:MAG: hypothetical protein IPG96_16415 [Proteobacteria bacterium]|nr:hypothetical protein [Pseudomonadota bacterium]